MPPPRVAGYREALGVHVFSSQQIIDPANPVPKLVAREVVAAQEALEAGQRVLASPDPDSGASQLRIEVERALTLTGGIEGEDDETPLCQGDPDVLVGRGGLSVGRVSGDAEDGGVGGASVLRHVDVGRHVEAGKTLVDEHLDAVVAPLQCAGDARVERCPVGESAERFDEAIADVALSLLDPGSGIQTGHERLSLLEKIARTLAEVGVHHLVQVAHDHQGILCRLAAGRELEDQEADYDESRETGSPVADRIVTLARCRLRHSGPLSRGILASSSRAET